jgi:hypothetical protein
MTPAPDMLHWKLGRKPQQRFFADIAVKARPYIKAALPHTPRTWAWGKDVTFGMFLNDRYGDCTCAALGHMEQVHSARAGHAEHPVDADIFELYHQTGVDEHLGDDDGRIMERVLAYMKRNGIRQTAGDSNNPAGSYEKIIGYAAVNPLDLEEVAAAGYLFGGLYAGLALPKSAIMQTNVRKWSCTTTDNAPGSWGGHAVWVTAVNSIGPVCATWAMRVQMSWCWWKRYVDELFVVVSDDWTLNTTAPSGFARDEVIRDLGLL